MANHITIDLDKLQSRFIRNSIMTWAYASDSIVDPHKCTSYAIRGPVRRLRYFRYCLADKSIVLNGGYTVEYMVYNNTVIRYRFAQCSLEDRFNKRTGKAVVATKPWIDCVNLLSYEEFDQMVRESMQAFKDNFVKRRAAMHHRIIDELADEVYYINNKVQVK